MSIIKLYSWNVNGIRAVINKGALAEFIAKEQPDILCLQETKAEKSQVIIDLPKYQEYWNSAVKKGYSGTAIFSKLPALSVNYDFTDEINQKYQLDHGGYGDSKQEGRVLTIEFADFYVVTVYTPNAKDDLSRLELREKHWDPAFRDYVAYLDKTKPVLMCGDFNVAHQEIDLDDPKRNKGEHGFTDEERAGFSNLIDAGFVDSFRHFDKSPKRYTWWSMRSRARIRNAGWRIDYWLVSERFIPKIKSAKIHDDIMGSDHCPVSIEVSL